MFRRNPYSWAGLGLAILLAAIIGIQLGESAVADINPVHFQGAAVHPRDRGAAVDPATIPPPRPASYYQAYGWDEGNAARRGECPGCAPDPAIATYAWVEGRPAPRLAGDAWRDSTPVTEPEAWAPGETAAGGHREVLRYADFPMEEKPAEETAAVEEPAKAGEE